jgi:hypothetical protein
MFVARAEWKPLELRQGDILVGIPFPFVSPSNAQLLGKIPNGEHARFPVISAAMHSWRDPEDVSYFTGQLVMRLSPCMVATQCCELRTNKKNALTEVAAITVCRIVPVRASIMEDAEKLVSLRENRDPRIAAVKSYKNYFGIGLGDGLSETEMMVDFAQMACVPANEFPAIMDKKQAQLTDVERMKLKIKLGVFFAQPTKEEIEANIAKDPWNIAAAGAAAVQPPKGVAAAPPVADVAAVEVPAVAPVEPAK